MNGDFLRKPVALWTEEETCLLREMKLAGLSSKDIGVKLGRKREHVADRWRWINRTASQREADRERLNANRKSQSKSRVRPEVLWPRHTGAGGNAPPEIFTERAARLAVERTASEVLMGDPPRGFSALEGRNSDGWMDKSLQQTQRRPITLATSPMTFQGED
jgi:hypothetical protein